jgi:hypothetical protein
MALDADKVNTARTNGSGAPDGLAYRLITGRDDADFCRRVSEWIGCGYVPHGNRRWRFAEESPPSDRHSYGQLRPWSDRPPGATCRIAVTGRFRAAEQ